MIFLFSVYSFFCKHFSCYVICGSVLSCNLNFTSASFLQEQTIESYGPRRRIPKSGIAMFGFGDMVVQGEFNVINGGIIEFEDNRFEFCGIARLRKDSLMFANIEFSNEWISIDVIKKIILEK